VFKLQLAKFHVDQSTCRHTSKLHFGKYKLLTTNIPSAHVEGETHHNIFAMAHYQLYYKFTDHPLRGA
jgi:hypothetical protein